MVKGSRIGRVVELSSRGRQHAAREGRSVFPRWRSAAVIGSCAAAVLALAGCGSSSHASGGSAPAGGSSSGQASSGGSSSTSGKTLNVGSISTLTGPVQFPQGASGAKAAFNAINAAGGINGYKINFISLDDAGSPSTTASDGQQLVNQDHVIANVGDMSYGGDCGVNEQLYYQADVSTLGFTFGPACNTNKMFGSVNTGGTMEVVGELYWMAKTFANQKLCYLGVNTVGGAKTAQEDIAVANAWLGHPIKFAYYELDQGISDGPTSYAVKAKQEGCQVVYYGGQTQQDVAMLKAMQAQNWHPTVMLDSYAYSSALIQGAGSLANGVYTNTDLRPFDDKSPATNAFRKAMASVGQPPSSFAEAGYAAAQVLADVIKSIKGPVTAKTVSSALKQPGRSFNNPLYLEPLKFGPFGYHSIDMVQVKNGKFVNLNKIETVPNSALVSAGLASSSNPLMGKS